MIFEIRNGSFGYFPGQEILKNVQLSVGDGDVLSILGPNGAGKTTLLKCMMGLLKWRGGASYLDGQNIAHIPVRKLWQKIAYVPQAKSSVFAYTTEEMVLLGRSAHIGVISQPKKEDHEKAAAAMEAVGITHLRGKECSRISGGELQMVLIARALTTEPSMLVLDEPESNLDFKNQLIILETIKELAKTKGISSIFNTHYPAHALKISNKSLILNKNGYSIFGNTQDVVNSQNMCDSFSVNVHISKLQVNNEKHHLVIPLNIV
ncbi:ABC transporter ATP-binding protein [Petroclostridium sp. X23]|jgi:iron complex transport system ATP-binding protein|uniref:ABC transporter ATP-binding protein n=1 Tax=Petroclostridium sp. X23 TaxID=3045146 RepID=UPI0024ADECD2|nr:ABC transporter ATP-binding protein [Petroclostridium sp. X23]WHH58729.1 ABC transporter ATP-binding protein [Petroclostridium sp. X23]